MTTSSSMTERSSALLGVGTAAALAAALVGFVPLLNAANAPYPAVGVSIPDNPIFAVAENKPNVLMVLDNSNSMDEAPNGAAAGSNSPDSKSESARGVIKSILTNYNGRMSVGLMAYGQKNVVSGHLYTSPYDSSYDPANYNPAFTGDRASTTKRFRFPNPTSAGNYIYYNVALPFYDTSKYAGEFCYSANSGFPTGPNGSYTCYTTKTGTSDAAPGTAGAGYSGTSHGATFFPTDSDYAQGISSFGTRISYHYVSPTWSSNVSPGRGYLHVPVKPLDDAQTNTLLAKLACNIPGAPSPCTTTGIQNAGLTPIEGTLLTARDYFSGTLSQATEGFATGVYPLPATCAKNYVILLTDGLPSTDKAGNATTDPAAAITAAAAAAKALYDSGVATYVVGFALPYGTDPATLDKIAIAGGTSKSYLASDKASLDAAMNDIFSDIDAQSGSSGAVATNTTGLTADTRVFKASFNPSDWSGRLEAFPVTNKGTGATADWVASTPAEASRKIFTWNGSSAVEFKWGVMPAAQQTALGTADVVSYLRGDRSKEGTTFRRRSTTIGDIVYSAPVYVRENVSYDALGNAVAPAMEIVAIGANDGMLHIFNATTGVEKFAYVPAGIDFAALKSYTTTGYVKSHKYFVDGQIAISLREDTGGKNILVGTLGRGGRGAFALDVTDPDNVKVLWDKTGAAAPDGMGFVLGAPFISDIDTGSSGVDVVFIPNGVTRPGALYEGGDKASLFVLNAVSGGNYYSRIDAIDATDVAGVSNALSSPRGWDDDNDGLVDYVYAGDLRGNVWRFTLGTSSATVQRLFLATDATSKRQPITGGMSISVDPVNYDMWVQFGTGAFLNSNDFNNRDVQSIYAVKDDFTKTGITRASLQKRTFQSQAVVNGYVQRFLEPNGTLLTGKSGWYIDLVSPTTGAEGERVVGTPQEQAGQLRVSSGIPGSNACVPAGGGYIYVIDAFSGTSTPYQAIDTNGDGVVDVSDTNNGAVTGGIGLSVGLVGDTVQNADLLTAGGSLNVMQSFKVRDDAARGRLSWREIIRD
ncbi:pilus assembly protein [Lysobacter xanthus]